MNWSMQSLMSFPMLEVVFLFPVEIVDSTLAVGHGYLASIIFTFVAQHSRWFLNHVLEH